MTTTTLHAKLALLAAIASAGACVYIQPEPSAAAVMAGIWVCIGFNLGRIHEVLDRARR